MNRKMQVLTSLERVPDQDAGQIAETLNMSDEAAGMLLLRLFRQGLIQREFDPREKVFFYSLNKKGQERLVYLRKREGLLEESHAKKSEYSKAKRKIH